MKILSFNHIFFLLIFISVSIQSFSQNSVRTTVRGIVTDSETKEPVGFANVSFDNVPLGTRTDPEGNYKLSTTEKVSKIKISFVGYQSETKNIVAGKSQVIMVKLKPDTRTLKEMVVKPKKTKYRNKNNPAVELIELVIKNKSLNKKEGFDFVEYEKYEKIQFALSRITEKFKHRKLYKQFWFVFDNIDTNKLWNKQVLPMYLHETLSDFYLRKTPQTSKEIIKANKLVSFKGYLDDQGVTNLLRYLYQDINVYDNYVMLLTNQVLSPIASTAPTFYKYFIIDTSMVENEKCIKLFFGPRNRTDMLFQGNMYIMLDSTYALKKIEMSVNKNINLNWVNELNMVQVFEKVKDHGWMLINDVTSIDYGIFKKQMGVFGERSVSFKNYVINQPRIDSVYKGMKEVLKLDADEKDEKYWDINRHESLTKPEQGVYKTMDSLKKMPAFRRTMNFLLFFSTGYHKAGFFDIGPYNTFFSFNPLEGNRARLGGRTNSSFSKKLSFDIYAAYGFKDERLKYYLSTAYSFTNKTIYEFPVKSLRFSYQYDVRIPGQLVQFFQEDNLVMSFKRGVNDKFYYNRTIKIEHLNEFRNHFSYTIGFEHLQQEPAGNLFYNTNDYLQHTNTQGFLNLSRFYMNLRYAPKEKFYQGRTYRTPIATRKPIIQLIYSYGVKYFGGDYTYHQLNLNCSKRFLLGIIGFTDIYWEAGKIFGKVPYPLLMIHHANQSYTYQSRSYNLMNFLEFVSDEYTALYIDHNFNGVIFNKIPLFKRLKWREIITGKILYGGITRQNDPKYQPDLLRLPMDEKNNPLTYTLEKSPYIEVSAGIGNIFKFLRIDVVKRLTYLDHANVTNIGIRAKFKMDF